LIEDGASKDDFTVELLGVYSKEECLSRETELAKTSLFPKGLNGNAGKYIEITEEVREKIKNSMKNRINPFSGGAIQRKRIEDGTHNFLNKESQSKNAKKRVEARTHHLLGGSIQKRSNKKRLEDGTHNFLVYKTCPHCGKEMPSGNFYRWHGDRCKFLKI
jgi:hypothetical protein